MAKDQIPSEMTRSVSLSGGMQDDVPEFLQDFPTLAYIENGRFRKANEVEKTLSQTSLNLVPPSGDPIAIEAAGDTLLVLGDESVREYREAVGWQALSGSGNPIATKSDVCSSSQEGGAMHFGWAKSTVNETLYVIAYETRTSLRDSAANYNVFIEVFTPESKLVYKEHIESARAPQVYQADDGRALVHFVDALNDVNELWVFDTTAKTSTKLDYSGAIAVYAETPSVEVIFDASSTVEYVLENSDPFFPTTIPLYDSGNPTNKSYDLIRMGYNPVGKNVWHHIHYPGEGEGNGVLLYKDKTSLETHMVSLDSSGQPTGIRVLEAGTFPSDPIELFPMAVFRNNTANQTWSLVGKRDATNNTSSLFVNRRDGALASAFPQETATAVDELNVTLVNASLHSEVTNQVMLAWTQVTLDETVRERYQVIADLQVSIQSKKLVTDAGFPSVSFFNRQSVPDHRLTSNILTNGEGLVFTCEQFVIVEPHQVESALGDIGAPSNPAQAGTKSTTNILVSLDETVVKPISTFDATTSKHTNFFMQEQNPWVGTLRKEGDSYFYCNRQALQKEDFGKILRKPSYNINLASVCWYVGEYRGNLFEVNTKPDKLQTVKFGESVILNTALPLWYAGGSLFEMSVLEQPEIRFVDTVDGDALVSAYIEPLSAEPDRWASYQIVIGFVDSNGQAHRSAPSFPLYVEGLNVQDVDVTTPQRTIGFTRPITSFEDPASYFIEVYTAKTDDLPVLAHRQPLPSEGDVVFVDSQAMDGVDYDPTRLTEGVYATAGGEVAADPWPSFDQAVVTSRRMFAIEGSTLYYSKLFRENISPEFNAVFTIPFGRDKKLKAIGKLDDKVLVFEKDAIHAVYGDGPDDTGSGAPFIVDNLQTTVGCEDPESVIEIPEGLLFFSSNSEEFHLIDRDLNIQDIGKPVQDLSENIDIQAAVQFPAEEEVRWYVTGGGGNEFGPNPDEPPTRPPRPRYKNILPDDPVLVYNYVYKKWTVLSGQPAVSVALFGNDVVRLESDWSVEKTSEDWSRSGLLKYRLPPLRVQDLQSFGRIREISLLGKYLSDWKDNGSGHEAGDLKITCKYDYEQYGLTHEYLWKANQDFDPDDGDRFQFGFKPGKPKCQAIQLTIEEVPTTKVDDSEPVYTNGRGFVLSGIDLLYSLKRGFGLKSLGQRRSK